MTRFSRLSQVTWWHNFKRKNKNYFIIAEIPIRYGKICETIFIWVILMDSNMAEPNKFWFYFAFEKLPDYLLSGPINANFWMIWFSKWLMLSCEWFVDWSFFKLCLYHQYISINFIQHDFRYLNCANRYSYSNDMTKTKEYYYRLFVIETQNLGKAQTMCNVQQITNFCCGSLSQSSLLGKWTTTVRAPL